MSSNAPLLSGTIEADDETPVAPSGSIGAQKARREPELLVPGTRANGSVGNPSTVEEGGIVSRGSCGLYDDDLYLSIHYPAG